MDTVKLILLKTETSGRMVWTGGKLFGSEQGPVAGWCGHGKNYLADKRDQWQDDVDRGKDI